MLPRGRRILTGEAPVASSPKGRAVFVSFAVDLYRRFARLIHELAKFGSVGAIAFVITTATANVLHGGFGVGPLTSNGIATIIATTFAYFANRFWTFRHRDRSGLGREYALFFVLNGIGLVITELFIGFTHYVLDQRSLIAFNIAQIIGTGVATLFRYWSYKRWVFLPSTMPAVDPHTGLPRDSSPVARPGTTADFTRVH
jgi:putative flippase GtrA